ncbi:MAG TPA: glycosyltransferase family 39 protein, partial [Acidimicrobiia bacterium]
MAAGPERRNWDGALWSAGAVALLAVVGAVVPLWIAHHYGALETPRSDDWSYLRTLFTWRDTGHWDFNHWVSMTLIGQLLLARGVIAFAGNSILAVRIMVAALGVVGLWAIVPTARALGLPRRDGVLVALTMAACPLWGPLAPTFMTDVPAFAVQMVALAFAIVGLRRRQVSLGYFAASLAVSYWAISIRQYAIVPAIAIVLVYAIGAWREGDRRQLQRIVGLTVILLIATAFLLHWWNGIPNSRSFTP